MDHVRHEGCSISRRNFVSTSMAVAGGGLLVPTVLGTGMASPRKETLNVGLVGCGGRGTGAAVNALQASENARLVAMGDVFRDRLESSRSQLANYNERAVVEDSACFVGFDAIDGVLGTDIDIVILATPPGFRPDHFRRAIDSGRHVFMEKPVAVDPAGVRTVMEAGRKADQQNLKVVSGTQRRHEQCYLDAMDKVRAGAIGTPVAGRCYWNMGSLWKKDPQPEWTDMETQLRNWLYYTWLSGDHIVEQHIHNIDVINWAMGGHPSRCVGVGGRQARTEPVYGHIFDHFGIDYEYPDGQFMLSMCRQQEGCPGRVEELVHGTEGVLRTSSGRAQILGSNPWKFSGKNPNPYVQEHRDLHAAIEQGTQLNESQRVAESTMTAIMGRMACYTGQELTWDQALNADVDLVPQTLEFGPLETPAVAVPGRTTLG